MPGRWRDLPMRAGAGLALMLLAFTASGQEAAPSPEALVSALRDGGEVVFLRHAITDPSQRDTGRLGVRSAQRNLTEEGRRQAAAIGMALRALDIPAGPVLASPVFRSRDTAEIAFGADAVEVTIDIVADDYAGGEIRAMVDATRRLLATPPPAGSNTILVGHRTPLEMATGLPFPDTVLPEGALAVFEPLADRGFRLRGTITADALIDRAGGRGGTADGGR